MINLAERFLKFVVMQVTHLPGKWVIVFVSCLFLMAFSCSRTKNVANPQKAETKQIVFFVSIPIHKFTSTRAPCFLVKIGEKAFSMMLDLGMRGDLSIISSYIDQISSKDFIESVPRYNFLGKEYPTNSYRIPEIDIGDRVTYYDAVMQENSLESQQECVVIRDENDTSDIEPGKIGWQIFRGFNLLLDIKNEKIAVCDSTETLQQKGYAIESFAKAPLLIERGLVEFVAQTEKGPLRCLLDTGTTWNIINAEIEEGKSLAEAVVDPSNILEYPSLKIDSQEFGPVKFQRIPIRIPIHIEAVLGMEFFENHTVFIDFSKNWIYFSIARPSPLTTDTICHK